MDDLIAKMNKVSDKMGHDNVIRPLLDEFGSWENLAIDILVGLASDTTKYSDFNLSCAIDRRDIEEAASCSASLNKGMMVLNIVDELRTLYGE